MRMSFGRAIVQMENGRAKRIAPELAPMISNTVDLFVLSEPAFSTTA